MKTFFLDNVLDRIVPYLPRRFRPGRLPYMFTLVVIMMVVMMMVALVTPYSHGIPIPLAFAFVLLVLVVAFSLGMSMSTVVQYVAFAGLLHVTYAAWVSGGIFSPRLAWYTLMPLVPFYAIGRRAGLFWMGVILAMLSTMLRVLF
jgi:hypothetical protein